MKLSARDAAAFLRQPDPKMAGVLIWGEDAMRVAQKRKELIAKLAGPEAEAEMRLSRLPAADLRRDGAALIDAVKAQGFFPGPRVVFVEGATDGLAPLFDAALKDWARGDAQILATAGQLAAKSALRKLFEARPGVVSIGIYDDPPGPEEIAAMLSAAGVPDPDLDGRTLLADLARALDPGALRMTVEKLGLYKHGDAGPTTAADIAAVAPRSTEAETDALLAVVAEGRAPQIAALLRRLYAQGTTPVSLCIVALRHFRQLHAVASDPGGAGQGIARLRPPVWGPRRDAMTRQAGAWGRDRLERAVALLIETDLQLRSASRAPAQALVERALIRLAMMARR
ncbi:DNA polymerase III subunit delta [Limimaricola cinnabarinus]|uniref:DNA-directed DNA polymerase n=1 Tax=Limimaricola cinnabarinus TaxID=1125964 RepID=A0A2G1MFB0_9RHOB|nr:DNA polymerase III subunit delta [Limimaricola cinnabarinus]PHP27421.1 DNA polymerase III subunit delta [Limimaricola cinnabarinus]